MCSINGFNFSNKELILKMNHKTKHRGPDDTGIFISPNWSLGHNRLSIIDLSKAGHQPMFSADKKLAIIFNGEIYNFQEIKKELEQKGYKFKSKTDTEVALYAYQEWGKTCLKKFNGMFALAILDTQSQELFLARDRIGIKPLYYYAKNNQFIFSSEVKAILAHNIDCPLNINAFNIYFRLMYVPAPMTMWENIYKLEPGHFLIIKNGQIKKEKYWRLEEKKELKNLKIIKEELKNLLTDSIQKRLISDRPVGVFLSGGIDSSLITSIMSDLNSKVETFSAGFKKTEESAKYNNDMLLARETAKYYKTNHHELILSAKDIAQNLAKTIYHMDEPISNHIQTVNLLLARFTSQRVKVVLGGDGADELFGGYERYYYSQLIDKIQLAPKIFRDNFLAKAILPKNLAEKINTLPGVERYLLFWAQKEEQINVFLNPQVNKPDFLPDFLQKKYFSNFKNKNFTQIFMQTDLAAWLPCESLVRSDKMSMASGLEQRVPFLDHRLVELANQIPVKYKIGKKGFRAKNIGHSYKGKVILREVFQKQLPDFVWNNPKWGWFSPAAKWLRNDLKEFTNEVLSPDYCQATRRLLDFKQIKIILDNHNNKKQYALNTIWSLITFQLWYREFMR